MGLSQSSIETSAFPDGFGDTIMNDNDGDIYSANPRIPEIHPDVPIHGIEGANDISDTDFDDDGLHSESNTDAETEGKLSCNQSYG